MVENQTANLTPNPSFGHNLYFRCPNGSCEPILNIYISIDFQWYEELLEPLGFDSCNHSLNMQEPPTREFTWECEGSFPHTLLHSRGHENATLGLSLGPQSYKPFALVASPKQRLRQQLRLMWASNKFLLCKTKCKIRTKVILVKFHITIIFIFFTLLK
jgi:hypothetical protein